MSICTAVWGGGGDPSGKVDQAESCFGTHSLTHLYYQISSTMDQDTYHLGGSATSYISLSDQKRLGCRATYSA